MKHSAWIVGACLPALIGLSGCDKVSDNTIEPVRLVDVAKATRAKGDSYLILDARDAASYDAGHIPGAQRMTAAQIDPKDPDPRLSSYKAIYVYGEHPNHNAAKALVKRLMVAEVSSTYLMDDGFVAWKAQGQPVVTEQPAPTSSK